jgi:hypothetical protein
VGVIPSLDNRLRFSANKQGRGLSAPCISVPNVSERKQTNENEKRLFVWLTTSRKLWPAPEIYNLGATR